LSPSDEKTPPRNLNINSVSPFILRSLDNISISKVFLSFGLPTEENQACTSKILRDPLSTINSITLQNYR